MTDNYEDIINLPHPTSAKHPQMSMHARAAQFAPFAALNGHSRAINESAKEVEASFEAKDSEEDEEGFSYFQNE